MRDFNLKIFLLLLTATFNFLSCKTKLHKQKTATWENEIVQAENNFANTLGIVWLHDAFLLFADKEASLIRNDSIITGIKNIDVFYLNQNIKTLTWKPDFVAVSKCGDLGYTYGKYQISITASLGKTKNHTGVFRTIWKRQKNGEWKFVLD